MPTISEEKVMNEEFLKIDNTLKYFKIKEHYQIILHSSN